MALTDPEDALRDALVARLFRNAGHFAVRFPTVWGIDADEAELEFDGSVITVSPIRRGPSVTDLHREFAADPIDDDWAPIRQIPPPRRSSCEIPA